MKANITDTYVSIYLKLIGDKMNEYLAETHQLEHRQQFLQTTGL